MRLVYLLSFFCSIFLINKTNGQNAGYFSVGNSGAYMARFFVSFNYNGNTVTYETGSYPVGQTKTLELPMGAKSCSIYVENLVFLGIWKGVFGLNFDQPVTKCFGIGGTTLHPSWWERDC